LFINDWDTQKFIKVFVACQLTFIGLISLSFIGINIPILREVFGFIYLIIIPGVLVIRILKLFNLHPIEYLLYTVGISLSFLMFIGFLINFLYPTVGILNPLSTELLVITFVIVTSILCVICYIRDKKFSIPIITHKEKLNFKKYSNHILFLLLIPILSVFSAYLVNSYNNHILILSLLIIVSLIPALVIFLKFPSEMYPISIGIMALSLLFHTSLISFNLWGSDINREFFFANLVNVNSYWNPSINILEGTQNAIQTVNGMLSVTVLAPIFSKICNVSLTWIFKIIYPILFSLLPVGLYFIYKKQTNEKIAFFSSVFFISILYFFIPMLALARQQIAELFLMLLILILIDNKIKKSKKYILMIIFAFSISVSHYGISYILILFFIFIGVIINLKKIINKYNEKFNITNNFIVLFIVFTFLLFFHTARGDLLITYVSLLDRFISFLFTNLTFGGSEAVAILAASPVSIIELINKYLNIILQFFIVIGLLITLLRIYKGKIRKEYFLFSIASFILLVLFLVAPPIASPIDPGRFFHISLIFLAPFSIIGLLFFYKKFADIRKYVSKNRKMIFKILSIFFGIFLLINTGFIHELANSNKNYFALNSEIDYRWYDQKEKISNVFLEEKTQKNTSLYYGHEYGKDLLHQFFYGRTQIFTASTVNISQNAYVFFRKWNVIKNEIIGEMRDPHVKISQKFSYKNLWKSEFFNQVIMKKSKIYDNGGAQLFY